MRLLSPRDSQILPNQFAGVDVTGQVTQPSSRRSSMKILSFVLFRFSRSVVEPSWGRSGTLSHLGFFFYFGSVVEPWLYLDDVMLYSCIVWSGDCKPTMYLFPYVLHGLCEDYLTCDIAFNAVMPLSRASTRGRYSRIEGVIGWYQSLPRLRSPLLDRIVGVVESRKMFWVI